MVATTLVVLAGAGCAHEPVHDGMAVVVEVIDGDTIDVEIGGRTERVRLIGIDTPETKKPDFPVECYGPEASAFTATLVPPGTRVRIERDIVGRDDYGRLLGYVYTIGDDAEPTADESAAASEVFVNREIVLEGFAQPMTIEPNSAHAAQFALAASDAEAADRGMWAVCDG